MSKIIIFAADNEIKKEQEIKCVMESIREQLGTLELISISKQLLIKLNN